MKAAAKERISTLSAFLLLASLAPRLAAQDAPAGPRFRVNAAEIEVSGRVQTQFNTSSVDTVAESELILRRVRFGAKVRVNDHVSGKIQAEFAGDRARIADAFLQLTLDPAFQVLAGRDQRPFGIVTRTSSAIMPVIERGARIRGITPLEEHNVVEGLGYADRDVGLQVVGAPEGAPLGLAYAFGYFAGPLPARTGQDADNPGQWVGQVSVSPLRPVRVGFSGSTRHFRDLETGAITSLRRGTAWAVHTEVGSFSPGVHFLGEIAWGDFNPVTGTEFLGAQGWLAYRTGPLGPVITNLEPVARVSLGELDGAIADALRAREGMLVTPGLNLYFGPLNRVMLNYDFWIPDSEGDVQSSFKAMFQLAF